ncbi:IclR family transcriptional regulator [Chitinophaga skermanii]|uniref:IclR family transcriptional regulator n=1 Tax=Chitinophaga skermanii TaxID=331697 RepID=A0A327QCR0_9BACT|nr:IclR family transcriptional regulator [Chitinophaga skermanii]RAJ02426.1 IclR family transcriptional regulator [Chitinophaga skermanii]
MIQSVQRAFEIVEYIAQNGNMVRLSDIADAMGLQRTTVHNILDTLKDLGYVEQDEMTPRYKVTNKLQCLYSPAISLPILKKELKPVLENITQTTKETSHLAVQMGAYFRYELKCEPERAVRISLDLAKEYEMTNTAIGKVFLAYSDHLQSQTLKNLSPAKANALRKEIAEIRKQGYALDIEQFEPDLHCIAVPFFYQKRVVAVIGVSGPAYRFQDKAMKKAYQSLKAMLAPVCEKLKGSHPS